MTVQIPQSESLSRVRVVEGNGAPADVALETLEEQIFPSLLEENISDGPLRLWVPGCSTGEDAYLLAACLLEFLADRGAERDFKLFATDADETAVARARGGFFASDLARRVCPRRLKRFFTTAAQGYQVAHAVRQVCTFARQDLAEDPPFAQLDLIDCRNKTVIPACLREKVLPKLHYALKPGGILLLSEAELLNGFSDCFALAEHGPGLIAGKRKEGRAPAFFKPGYAADVKATARVISQQEVQREADRLLLEEYAPAGVVINHKLEILQFRGKTGAYLEPAAGAACFHLLKMAPQELSLHLARLLDMVKRRGEPVRGDGLRFRRNDKQRTVSIKIIPFGTPRSEQDYFLVLFHEDADGAARRDDYARRSQDSVSADERVWKDEVVRLNEELTATRDYLQSVIEQLESSNEELRAANEEIVCSNEELRAAYQKLEHAQEEVQATNEELCAANKDLRERHLEADGLNSDLINLLNSVEIPILIVGPDLRLRRFTPSAGRIWPLIPADIGRPITDLKPHVAIPALAQMIRQVLETLSGQEREVQDQDGHWHLLRVRPYRAAANRCDGAVVLLEDIDVLKRSAQTLKESRDFAQAIVDTVRQPLVLLDGDLCMKTANRAFYQAFRLGAEEVGKPLLKQLSQGPAQLSCLGTLCAAVARGDGEYKDYQFDHEFPGLGHRTLLVNARRVQLDDARTPFVLLALEDVTERERIETALRGTEARLQATLGTAAEGVVTLAETGEVLASNRAMEGMFGYACSEMNGKNLNEFVPAFDSEKLAAGGSLALQDNATSGKVHETFGRRKDGSEFPIQLMLSELPSKERLFTCLVRDVSGMKEAQARSLETERLAAIGQVSAGLTHESRNALQRGQASLEMLRREVHDRPAAVKLIAQLEQAQDDLLHLFEDVGEYAAPMKLQLKKARLEIVIRGAWEQLQAMRGRRAIDFRLDDRGLNTTCEIDARRMGQVFRNILENSLLACTDPVRIDVTCQETMIGEQAALRISLRNNGPPFTWEERRKIFYAFFTTRTHGSGLGMAIAKRVVEAHGGWIGVGPAEQQGAEILITLPRGCP